MSEKSKIEWTDATWNPVRGCTKISPGCAHCYAETFAERFRGVPGHPYEQGFDLRLSPRSWPSRFRWTSPETDLRQLDERPVPRRTSPTTTSTRCAGVMQRGELAHLPGADQAVRADARPACGTGCGSPRDEPHIWWGVSVENRKHGLPRIEHLRDAPAAVRFLSVEPLLEDLGAIDLDGIDWVIVGGESGHGARPMDAEWVREPPRPVPGRRASRSSSSSGAGSARSSPGASSTAGPTTRCPPGEGRRS